MYRSPKESHMVDSGSGIKTLSTEIVIVGGGPAGLTAGLYASRAGRKTSVLVGRTGSRLSIGYSLENYPGFISIDSQELLDKFMKHAEHFGAQIITGDAIDYNITADPKYVTTRDTMIEARAVILAPGRSMPRAKMIPGEERLLGMGVSYCATCDGPLYRGLKVAALGSTDDAAEDILLLNQMGSEVYWISGSEEWQVSASLFEDVQKRQITIFKDTTAKEIVGDKRVEKLLIDKEEKREELEVSGVFIFRDIPAAPLFRRAGIEIDHRQCVKVDRFQKTNIEGVFAAGDVTCGGMQVVAAAGEGCVAAMRAVSYLRKKDQS